MQIVYGTGNQAKLSHMRRHLEPLGLTLVGLDSFDPLPSVAETGRTPLQNARLKAHAYYRMLARPVFSCDSGLYFTGLPDALQPGVHVRTPQGRYLDDGAMTAYYGDLAREYGGLTARYHNAICFVLDEGHVYESEDASLWGDAFRIVAQPHPRREAGFPLDRISVHIPTGLYYYDMDKPDVDGGTLPEGFRRFFRQALSL